MKTDKVQLVLKVEDKASPLIAQVAHSLEILAIDKMPADREMDALMAEIMGCTIHWHQRHKPDGPWLPLCGCKRKHRGSLKPHEERRHHLKRYSANIAATWEIVEYFLGHSDQKVYLAFRQYVSHDLGWYAPRHIVCLRICRAALKAVKEQELGFASY